MKKIKINMYIVLVSLAIAGCKKDDSTQDDSTVNNSNGNGTSTKTVFVCGYEGNSIGKSVAKYWKDGEEFALSDGSRNAIARAIWVDGEDVHVVGYEDGAGTTLNAPTYWLNGVAAPLGVATGAQDSAIDIYVSNETSYIVGYVYGPDFKYIAKLWINGAGAIDLSDGTKDAKALGVFVDGDDVYVCGYEDETSSGSPIPKYWKNGVGVNLTNGSQNGEALAIYVSGDNVYVAGSILTENGAYNQMIWVNGVAQSTIESTTNSYAFDIDVEAGDVYAAGSNDGGFVRSGYWLNGGFNTLLPAEAFAAGSEGAYGIQVDGDDVYVAGVFGSPDTGNSGVYWINGEPHYIGSTPFSDGAFGIFVK